MVKQKNLNYSTGSQTFKQCIYAVNKINKVEYKVQY